MTRMVEPCICSLFISVKTIAYRERERWTSKLTRPAMSTPRQLAELFFMFLAV